MFEGTHIVDTVVLMYFLLVGREGLLGDLLGRPLQVPVAVYDPEDREGTAAAMRPELLSEMRQAVRHYEVAASGEEPELPGPAAEALARIRRVDELHDDGDLVVIEMTPPEQVLAAGLQGSGIAEYGRKVPLGPGEAACVAVAFERGWTIATDDTDALKVLGHLCGGQSYPYERVRKLLMRAADEKRITRHAANRLHEEMCAHGFWDAGRPFD